MSFLKHKYIRLADTKQAYELLIEDRLLEEAAVVAITEDRTTVPDEYQFSTRTTNNDDLVKGDYNALDPVNHFGGLELIWGYFGWTWEDYVYDGETLKGGRFIILKDTPLYPRIYDGYRLLHINSLTQAFNKVISVGYFDNSEIITANNAFTTRARLNEGDNIWPKLQEATNMFADNMPFTDWTSELYFPSMTICKDMFTKYSAKRCPVVNFNAITSLLLATIIDSPDDTNDVYLGDFDNSIVKGLETCYYYGTSRINTRGAFHFKPNYKGSGTLTMIKAILYSDSLYAKYYPKFYIGCNVPWTIDGSIVGYNTYGRLDLSELDFSKSKPITPVEVPPKEEDEEPTYTIPLYYFLDNFYLSTNSSNTYYVPGLPVRKLPFQLYNRCTFTTPYIFDADPQREDVDMTEFTEFQGCNFNMGDSELTINNVHLYDSIKLSFGNTKTLIGVYNDDSIIDSSYVPVNVRMPLCPKQGSKPILVTYKYIEVNKPIQHTDEDIILTANADLKVHSFYGKYDNCTYSFKPEDPAKPINVSFKLADGISPVLKSEEEIFFPSQWLGSDWGLNNKYIKRLYIKDLKLRDPSIKDGVNLDNNRYLGYYYWYMHLAVNLEYIELPNINGMSYRFDQCTKLDPKCIVDHFRELNGKGRTTTINRTVWDKMSNEELELVRSKAGTFTIYENETT